MKKNLQFVMAIWLVLSMLLGACTSAAPATQAVQEPPTTEVGAATEVVAVATDVPPLPTETPAPAEPIDFAALFQALVESIPADKGYGTVKAASLNEELADQPPFLLDVREVSEIEADGYIEGAINIPVRELLKNLAYLPGLDEPIVVYCASGHRGAFAMTALRLLGYTNVRNLAGGAGAWKKAELPLVTGALPAAPQTLSTPIIADQALFTALDEFLKKHARQNAERGLWRRP